LTEQGSQRETKGQGLRRLTQALPWFLDFIATIKIVDTHLDGSFPSCLCPKNLKAIKASCVFGASAAEKAPRPAVCRQF
jgi:hypothetical protein